MKTIDERVAAATVNNDAGKTKEVFIFLDELRDSGATNMFGARPYIVGEFGMEAGEAKKYLMAWMGSY